MIGLVHHYWTAITSLLFTLYLVPSFAQDQYMNRYLYSKLSCEDLIPRHASTFTTTTTSSTTSSVVTTQGGTVPTRSTVRRPNPTIRPPVESLRTPVEVTLLNGYKYAPGRPHKVAIQSAVPFEGFMLQILKNHTSIVGTFLPSLDIVTRITCPFGAEEYNTALDNNAPVLMRKIDLVWKAPYQNMGILNLRLSLVIGNEYQTVEKSLIPSILPPLEDHLGCGITQTCFRACPTSMPTCAFPESIFTAILKNSSDNSSAIITLGAQIGLLRNYGAIGFTRDGDNLSEMDLNVCFSPDVNRSDIDYAHMYLQDLSSSPLPHQGVVSMDTSYMDGNVLWCQFTRPLLGNDPARLSLDDPTYIFFFRGHQHEGVFSLPEKREMMRIRQQVSQMDGLPFSSFVYLENGGQNLKNDFNIVSLSIIFFLTKFRLTY